MSDKDDLDLCPEGVFGLVDAALDRVERSDRRPKKAVPRPPRALPSFKINKPDRDDLQGVDFENAVSVPEDLLRTIAQSIDKRTAQFNSVLLTHLIPLLLSYDTGTSYAQAALKDGLNLEINFDQGLADAVRQIGYINVLFHFIKKSKLPKSLKKKFMFDVSDKLASSTVQGLIDSNKAQQRQQQLQQLQAVVYSQKDRKATVHTNDKAEPPKTPGVRKGRRK